MMDFYFNQTATLNKRQEGFNEFNQPVYGPDTTISCYISYKRKMVRDSAGQDIVSESSLYTDTAAAPGDKVTFNGSPWIVISCSPMYMLDGSILFYEVSL